MANHSMSQLVVKRLRIESGLSQRALAYEAGTSGPTVASYESGRKEPRLSTLQRLAASVGFAVEVRLVRSDPGSMARARRERRSLALAAATAAAVEQDRERAVQLAQSNLDRMDTVVHGTAARALLDEWRDTIARGVPAVRAALLELGDHGHDLRQMTPFAGLLSDGERAAAMAAADAPPQWDAIR
jgi:transcriptional regulator with XRE-family HTH domain